VDPARYELLVVDLLTHERVSTREIDLRIEEALHLRLRGCLVLAEDGDRRADCFAFLPVAVRPQTSVRKTRPIGPAHVRCSGSFSQRTVLDSSVPGWTAPVG
jgi:hypothetical protein